MLCAGKVEASCGVWIDKFKRTTPGHGIISVLTHFHNDHISGLTPSWSGQLYCSPETATQVHARFPSIDVMPVQPDTGQWTEVSDDVRIALVSCDHLVGAVMVCLKKGRRKYVHTGDFVANAEWLREAKPVFQSLGMRRPDILFVDNTYNHEDIGLLPDWKQTHRILETFLEEEQPGSVAVIDHAGVASSFLNRYGIPFRMSRGMKKSGLGKVFPHDRRAQVHVYCRGERVPDRYDRTLVLSSLWFTCQGDRVSRTAAAFDARKGIFRICLATHSDASKLYTFTKWMGAKSTVQCAKLHTGDCPRLSK